MISGESRSPCSLIGKVLSALWALKSSENRLCQWVKMIRHSRLNFPWRIVLKIAHQETNTSPNYVCILTEDTGREKSFSWRVALRSPWGETALLCEEGVFLLLFFFHILFCCCFFHSLLPDDVSPFQKQAFSVHLWLFSTDHCKYTQIRNRNMHGFMWQKWIEFF